MASDSDVASIPPVNNNETDAETGGQSLRDTSGVVVNRLSERERWRKPASVNKIKTEEATRLSTFKQMAQTSLDVAVLTSNIATLRIVIDTPNLDHRNALLGLLICSISVTVLLGFILLIHSGTSLQRKTEGSPPSKTRWRSVSSWQNNNEDINCLHKLGIKVILALTLVSLVLNLFITGFGPRNVKT